MKELCLVVDYSKKNKYISQNEHHPFHIVDPSPWPLVTSVSALQVAIAFLLSFQYLWIWFHFILLTVVAALCFWFYDVVKEATFEGHHTARVQQGMRLGMIFFILSEVMFFFSFFWSFFHFSLSPSIWIGAIWPPKGIQVLNPQHLPLLNTTILLSSGVSVTFAHVSLVNKKWLETFVGLAITIIFGIIFTLCQGFEYIGATFTINDSAYGSIFYLATGFHGFHVLIGTIFLLVCLIRHYFYHFTPEQHFGFEAAAWYWHFVDVVWLFLFIVVYIWGS